MNIIGLRLISGIELIGDYDKERSDGSILYLKNAAILNVMVTQNGAAQVQFTPPTIFAEDSSQFIDLEIPRSSIFVRPYTPRQDLLDIYTQASSGLVIARPANNHSYI